MGELAAVHGGGVAGEIGHDWLRKVVEVLAVGHPGFFACCPPCCHTQLVGVWVFGCNADGGDLVVELKWFFKADKGEIVGEEMLAPPVLRMGHNVTHRLDLGSIDVQVASGRSTKEHPVDRVKAGTGETGVGGRQPFRR